MPVSYVRSQCDISLNGISLVTSSLNSDAASFVGKCSGSADLGSTVIISHERDTHFTIYSFLVT